MRRRSNTIRLVRTLLGAALTGMMIASPATAQEIGDVGVTFGYENGMLLNERDLSTKKTPEDTCFCPSKVYDRQGNARTMWLSLGVVFPKLFAGQIDLEARASVGYTTSAVTGKGRMFHDADVASSDTIVFIERPVMRDVDYDMTSFRLDFVGRYELYAGLGVEAGLWASYRTAGRFSRRDRLPDEAPTTRFVSQGPDDRLTNDRRTRILDEGTEFAAPPFAGGAIMGVSYNLPLLWNISLQSSVRVRTDLRTIWRDASWRSLSVGGGLGLQLNMNPEPEIPDSHLADLLDEPPSPEYLPLQASIDIYSEGDGTERIQTLAVSRKVVLTAQYLPFVPSVYFDKGDHRIPSRYHLLSDGSRFTADSLVRRDLRWLHYHGLNLLGLRMREAPSETALLLGTVAPGEPAGLGRRRAETVRRYLEERWGIESARIRIEEGKAEKGSVTVQSESPAIIAPVVSEWMVAGLDAPQIGLRPAMDGGAGLRRWDITVRQGEREIASYSSDAEGDGEIIDMGMVLKELDSAGTPPPLLAELAVEDSAGAISVARDRLPIQLRSGAGSDIRRSVYLLLPPDNGAPFPASSLESIAAGVRSGDRVTVRYPASPEHLPAAEEYAGRIATTLGTLFRNRHLHDVDPRLTPDAPVETTGLPEEILFSRAVTVVVEQSGGVVSSRQ